MERIQLQVAATVVPLVQRARSAHMLTAFDHAQIALWKDYAASVGFDRMATDRCHTPELPGTREFVALHRRGEPWATYLFSRKGSAILAWCGVTSADLGEFLTIGQAFQHVLSKHGAACPPAQNVVTDFMPRLRRAAGG